MTKIFAVGFASVILCFLAEVIPSPSGRVAAKTTETIVDRTHDLLIEVENLRELNYNGDLQVDLVTQDEIRKVIGRELDEQITPEMDRQFGDMYALLGLMPPGSSMRTSYEEMAQEQVAGLYDPTEKKFYVVDIDFDAAMNEILGQFGDLGGLAGGLIEGMGIDLSQSMSDAVIVHELTHAIDDQHFDLQSSMKRLQESNSDDEALAYQSLAEGDATRIMNTYAMQSLGLDSSMLAGLEGMQMSQAESMLDFDPFIERLTTAPYFLGEAFVRFILDNQGETGLDRAFETPPVSMEQVMHPTRFFPFPDNPSIVGNPDLSAALPEWNMEAEDTLGELITALMFEMGLGDKELASSIADGWDGDRLTMWKSPQNDLCMAWVSVWDSDSEAREFFNNYQNLVEAKYKRQGTWKTRNDHSAVYTGLGLAMGIEISSNTVCIVEGVPESLCDTALRAAWNTPIEYI
jgi:hypothetical protein